jgi:hypothetical protein
MAKREKKADQTEDKAEAKAERLAEKEARKADGKQDVRLSLAEIRALSVAANDKLASGELADDAALKSALLVLDGVKFGAATSEPMVPPVTEDGPVDEA